MLRGRVPAVAVLLALGFLLTSSARAETVAVSLLLEGKTPAKPVPVTLVFRGLAAGQGEAPVREIQAEAPGVHAADLASGPWELVARADGFWSRSVQLVARPEGSQAEIALFPAARVDGRLSLPPGEPMPQEVVLRFASAVGTSPLPIAETETVCPVAEGAFVCEVPAGRLDLRVRARGFLSHYRWAVAVEPARTFPFGNLKLRRGASVSGWVATADGSPISSSARASLAPRAAGPAGSPADRSRTARSALSAPVQPNGFFHLEEVPLGSYVLSVEHPGFAPARLHPVQVQENAETEIRKPLLLQPAATLRVFLDPAIDPRGEPWRLQLFEISPISGVRELAAEGRAELDGSWRRPGIAPGRYAVVVGDLRASMIANQLVEVEPRETTVQIEVPLVWVEGRVRLGGEPLPATLWFGGRHGEVRVRVLTDQDGRFQEALPRAGSWALDVEAEEPRIHHRLRSVQVSSPEGRGTARLDIDIPGTRLTGKVVDERGGSVAGATVLAVRPDEADLPVTVTTDKLGAFELAGLSPGLYRLEAEHRKPPGVRAVSDVVTVDLAEDREAPEAVLVLADNRKLRIRVTAQGRGVPQARVQALPRLADGPAPLRGRSVITDVSGEVEIELPARTASLDLLVLPPGFSLKMARVPLSARQEVLEIPVESAGGTLILEMPEPRDGREQTLAIVLHDGVPAPQGLLSSWAQLQGISQEPGRLAVPALQPGLYEACLRSLSEAVQSPAAAAGGSCASGTLPAHGELRLRLLPSSAKEGPSGR